MKRYRNELNKNNYENLQYCCLYNDIFNEQQISQLQYLWPYGVLVLSEEGRGGWVSISLWPAKFLSVILLITLVVRAPVPGLGIGVGTRVFFF